MFAFCRGIHTNPAYQWYGTVDCAILNVQKSVMMFFSIVKEVTDFKTLAFYPPFPAELVLKGKKPTTDNLRSLFEMVKEQSDATIDVTCYDELDADELLDLVIKELEPVPEPLKVVLLAAIRKVFAARK